MAKDTTEFDLDSCDRAVMQLINEHEELQGVAHLAFKKVLSEKQQLRAENIALRSRNAELEKELKEGPAGARLDVMLELMATVKSLTREIELLKQKEYADDPDKQSGQHLPSQPCCTCGSDSFVKLLRRYLELIGHKENLNVLPEEAAIENEELLHQAGQAARIRRSMTQSISSRRNSSLAPGVQIRRLKRSNTSCTCSPRREQENKLRLHSWCETEEGTKVHLRPRIGKRYSAPPRFTHIPTGNNFKEVTSTAAVSETPVSRPASQCAT